MKHLPPSQREVESQERDLFANGDIKALAALLDVDQSLISKQLNENEPEHKSPFYVYIRRLYFADQHRPELGDGYVALAAHLRNGWRGTREPEQVQVVELARGVNESMFELLRAQILSLPYGDQLRAVDKAMSLLDQFKNSLHFENLDADQDESAHPS